jgi:hypothetical protein
MRTEIVSLSLEDRIRIADDWVISIRETPRIECRLCPFRLDTNTNKIKAVLQRYGVDRRTGTNWLTLGEMTILITDHVVNNMHECGI